MYASKILLSLLTSFAALGSCCYSGGMKFSDMRGGSVDGAIKHFCSKVVPNNFNGRQGVSHCYSFPEDNSKHRVEMNLKNNSPAFQGTSFEECYQVFSSSYKRCPHGESDDQSFGSWSGFSHRIDPQAGPC